MVEKKIKMGGKCCMTCAYILMCPDILTYKCKKYEETKADKEELSTRYIDILKKLSETVKELELVEMGMKITEKANTILKTESSKDSEDKPAISKRNKDIAKLIEQGKSIKEISETLDIKPETVGLEIEYLLKVGMIKARPN